MKKAKKIYLALIIITLSGISGGVTTLSAEQGSVDSTIPQKDLVRKPHTTNYVIDSSGIDQAMLDHKLNPPEEKTVFYKTGDAKLGVNGDGDPNVSMTF